MSSEEKEGEKKQAKTGSALIFTTSVAAAAAG